MKIVSNLTDVRASIEAQTVAVEDGGGGAAATGFDNTPFETQGIWIP